MDGALYRETVERIRASGTDVLINLTTGPGARFMHDPNDPTKAGTDSTTVCSARSIVAPPTGIEFPSSSLISLLF